MSDPILSAEDIAQTRAAAMNVYHEAPDPFMRGMLAIFDSHEALRAERDERAYGEEAARADAGLFLSRLHCIEAVAGNVVLVDDEADLLVPDWRAVVEVLREAIDALRAALEDQAAKEAQ